MSRLRHWLLPSYGTLLALAALSLALFFRGSNMFAHDGDGARHIRLGRAILEHGHVLSADIFSHTRAGESIVLHEWLSEVVLAWADHQSGLPGVAVLAAGLFVIAVLGVFRSAEELGAARPLALLVGLIAMLLQSIHLLPRPHLFSTAFAAVYMVVLLRFARGGRNWTLAPLPILMIAWANFHGGFLLGIVLVCGFLLGALLDSVEFTAGRRAARPLAGVLIACLMATLVTPAGPALWAYTLGHLGTDDFLLRVTQEFRSVDFHRDYGKFFFGVLFAGPALWMTGRVRVTWLGAGFYLFFAASALHSARNLPLFSITALPWLAAWTSDAMESGGAREEAFLDRLRRMGATDRLLQPWAWSVPMLALAAYAAGPGSGRYAFNPTTFPVAATAKLHDIDTSGRIFNQMQWGGYLLYTRPDIPVFIDGQTDFYGEELAREYLAVINGRGGWRAVLDRHDVSWTLTSSRAPLNQLLALDPEWRRVYTDPVATIFRRGETGP